ncbi:type II toxin-antitoxin system PemK/MazF family toxin [Noviherbaspirillum galbum]|uniref:Type II toxin-antitoxin system PemK/MazF family toxin n=1 Tax=Noviherbaspirillum galbum TaxID=2709383 RepID=A0A6B3SHV4_9BURK|nr:type II toxin-antitoxin system PemK/MazF family toxin [Noviherbaspirillum galbum]NEX60268.1 type II toxin-antitoxin system PemK/MazF family toxin [Noviherbaspirillum galbum]
MVMRAEIWLIDFDKPVGSVTQKRWPCVVVSPEEMDEYLSTLIVAPLSTRDMPAPFRIPVNFMQKDGLILLDQICTMEKSRLVRKLGVVSDDTMARTLEVLQEVFAH